MLVQVPESMLKKCRYCGETFVPASGRQEVCKKPACQKKRLAEVMRNYYARKKAKKTK